MDRKKNYSRFIYYIIISLYSITDIALAETPTNTNIAGPSASATGNVTNSAVQVLQGPFALNTYGAGISCQGPTLSFQSFGYNNLSNQTDPSSYQNNSINSGISAGIQFPLDNSLQKLCKARVEMEIERQRAERDKSRLDYELVRLLRCGEAKKQGIDFHPESPYYKVCADVVLKINN